MTSTRRPWSRVLIGALITLTVAAGLTVTAPARPAAASTAAPRAAAGTVDPGSARSDRSPATR